MYLAACTNMQGYNNSTRKTVFRECSCETGFFEAFCGGEVGTIILLLRQGTVSFSHHKNT
jgi:hypothetical protein